MTNEPKVKKSLPLTSPVRHEREEREETFTLLLRLRSAFYTCLIVLHTESRTVLQLFLREKCTMRGTLHPINSPWHVKVGVDVFVV